MVGLCWEGLSLPGSSGTAVQTFALPLSGSRLESPTAAALGKTRAAPLAFPSP